MRKMKRIHVVSTGPRTGTTLMAELIYSCFDVDQYCEHEARIFKEPNKKGNIFLTKYPTLFDVGIPLILNRHLYIICILRDPRNSIVSIHGNSPDQYWAGLKYWKLQLPIWYKLKKHSRFVTIKYEDLINDPDRIQEYISERLPFLRRKGQFSNYHKLASPSSKSMKAMRGIRKISTSGTANWRNHLPRVKAQLEIHGSISQDLIELGYENDEKWTDLLRDIEPDYSSSNRTEFYPRTMIIKAYLAGCKAIVISILRTVGLSPMKIKHFLKHTF